MAANIHFLAQEAGLIKFQTISGFVITSYGRTVADCYRSREGLLDEFNELKAGREITPQERGRKFQKLFARFVSQADGWKVEESVATPGEELDVVIWRGDSFYFVECKWEKKAIRANDLRDFAGKLSERTGVRGMFVSMSGFTAGMVRKARERIGTTPMILLGPQDVENLFSNDDCGLGEMIEEKYRALVMRKELVFQ